MIKKRIFVKKKENFDTESKSIGQELANTFHNDKFLNLKVINIYDIQADSNKTQDDVINKVLSNKNTDQIISDQIFDSTKMIAIEYLPGQYDPRANWAVQCSALLNQNSEIEIKAGKLFVFDSVSSEELAQAKGYIINPIESREKDLNVLDFQTKLNIADVKIIDGFISLDKTDLKELFVTMNLSMTFDDFLHIQKYFNEEEKRNPSETEIKMLDTYWSDHCRHTTFETEITSLEVEESSLKKEIIEDWNSYLNIKNKVNAHKPSTLMSIATTWPKFLKKSGKLQDVEVSSEINACTLIRDVKIGNENVKYSIQFKNETHNHPTEIEPFGGASTCLGGAIRDPLSGRSYVYQGLRVTGAGDITEDIKKTLKGKLPQKKISKVAAQGFSSYGNEIGLATTLVKEIFHPGYKAKRMEVGAVVAANPADFIKREEPQKGDFVILLGGKTGRDGIGGATGSSKKHNSNSIQEASTEVQKGNAPEERKIQRLFRNKDLTKLIKKSNDFGAGGLSVAVGEIADSLEIFAERVPLKYLGLNAHEIILSESQERMAIVIDPSDLNKVKEIAAQENVEATHIATVTDSGRLIIKYKDKEIVNVARKFLETNGVRQKIDIKIGKQNIYKDNNKSDIVSHFNKLNIASQKGLIEMFDFSIGNSTVLAPFGGKKQNSPTQVSVQKVPVMNEFTNTSTVMSYGFNPFISTESPYLGGIFSVIESIAKIVACGAEYQDIRFSFQEYFERLGNNPKKWGKPLAALLGAYRVQREFELAAIGGKDSMSGSFEEIDVPPTLISFAITTVEAEKVISTDLKNSGNKIYLLKCKTDENGMPNISDLKTKYNRLQSLISNGVVKSSFAIEHGGIIEAIAKMSFGTDLGFDINHDNNLLTPMPGSIVFESVEELNDDFILLGKVTSSNWVINGKSIAKEDVQKTWEGKFDDIFAREFNRENISFKENPISSKEFKIKNPSSKPKVFIPVFPGTNCEYDMERKFSREGGECKQFVFRNASKKDIMDSMIEMVNGIKWCDILVLSGGFSASDEPDGSGKFIASILAAHDIKEVIHQHLIEKKLIIGICNGFQALVRSGLLPFGQIKDVDTNSPILFKNDINKHVAKYVKTKVATTNSPWLKGFKLNDTHTIPVSHGEGRFMATKEVIDELIAKGMVAFQYVDSEGNPTMNPQDNPNGSTFAIEGIVSEDGLILGKMGHSERYEDNICKNIYGNKDQNIFKNAIKYIKGE